MTIQTLLKKNNFTPYYAKTGTEYWTGYVNDKEIVIRISNHAPNSEFLDYSGKVEYRDTPDYRIDPEQDDTEMIKELLKKDKVDYIYFSYIEDWERNKNRYQKIVGKIDKKHLKDLDDVDYEIITYKEYADFKKKHKKNYYFFD